MSAAQMMSAQSLEQLADGCAVLGGGGGGSIRESLLAAQQAFEDFGPVTLIDLDSLDDDALIMPCGLLGAPAVAEEKLGDGREGAWLRDRIEHLTGRRVAAFMPSEVGGANGVSPFGWAACAGVPIVDADGMGRAFPHMRQVTMRLAGIDPGPSVMTDERGNISVFHPNDVDWLERVYRMAATASGGLTVTAEFLMSAAEARGAVIRGSLGRALRIGQARLSSDPLASLLGAADATTLIEGRIVEIDWADRRPRARGSISVEGAGHDEGRWLRLELQDEILLALENGRPLAVVPDIITVLDSFDYRAIPTEDLRLGQRVVVVAMPSADVWMTPAGLQLVGPRAFGYDLEHPRNTLPASGRDRDV
ncbi:DUF917 domain-containing protein [Leifsonia kafniensis]|uniref:DUF917 domain-containing protein n=1 Tax=Leifsonia kafniensis TaxID=475957 RepID=A0ABP7KDB0_9MICO